MIAVEVAPSRPAPAGPGPRRAPARRRKRLWQLLAGLALLAPGGAQAYELLTDRDE